MRVSKRAMKIKTTKNELDKDDKDDYYFSLICNGVDVLFVA